MLPALGFQPHLGLVKDLDNLIVLGVAVGGGPVLDVLLLRLLLLSPHGLSHDGRVVQASRVAEEALQRGLTLRGLQVEAFPQRVVIVRILRQN